jgi:hypothetical protein
MNRIVALYCAGALSIGITGSATAQTSHFDVIATGLDGPRGLHFGPDGNLYIAEAGTGGPMTTVGLCTQVPVPVGSLQRWQYRPDFLDQSGRDANDRGGPTAFHAPCPTG